MMNSHVINFTEFRETYHQRIENCLERYLPETTTAPQQLHQAMRYAVLNGGKRIRPLLVYATGKCFAVPPNLLDIPAAAVELIHCYSLVHDDLPAMDDDNMRRGKPSCHKAYNEATAILVGDALQALAFELLASTGQSQMIQILSHAGGSRGMVGGQQWDLARQGMTIELEELTHIQALKTGELIKASVKLGAIATQCSTTQQETLDQYASALGLAFQIQDDICDNELNITLTTAQQQLQTLYHTAITALSKLSANTHYLEQFARFVILK